MGILNGWPMNCAQIYKFTLIVSVETTQTEDSPFLVFNRRILLALYTVSMEKQNRKVKKKNVDVFTFKGAIVSRGSFIKFWNLIKGKSNHHQK